MGGGWEAYEATATIPALATSARRAFIISIAADYMIGHSDNSGAGEESASRPTHDEGFFPFFSR